MLRIAHRGFAADYPENTLQAVSEAASRADAIEIDVRRCGSDELVVLHDATVDRVTDATGPVSEFSAAELGTLSVLNTDNCVPTLESVLEAIPSDTAVNVELKERGTAGDALEAANASPNDVFVSAFDPEVLAEARTAAEEVPRALLFETSPRASLETAVDLDCPLVHPEQTLCLGSSIVERAHDAGLSVNAWTVDSAQMGKSLAERGIDGVIADSWRSFGQN